MILRREVGIHESMELKGMIVPQFRGVPLPRVTRVFVRQNKRDPMVRVVRVSFSPLRRENFPLSYCRWKSFEVHCNDSSQSIQHVSMSDSLRLPEFAFDRVQPSDQEYCGVERRGFGKFIACGAALDEEYFTAAWLRAEAHCESLSYMRNVDSYKRKYAEQEFYALKHRCAGRDGNSLKCFCFVTIKKEDKNVRRTVLNSTVGTLDLSIRQFFQGETFPGELKRPCTVLASHEPNNAHKYAYIANVCVSKYARRQGIASNMLYLGKDLAISEGMKQLFVHVNADNKPAQELYRKTGFEMVEAASTSLAKDQRLLMCMRL